MRKSNGADDSGKAAYKSLLTGGDSKSNMLPEGGSDPETNGYRRV